MMEAQPSRLRNAVGGWWRETVQRRCAPLVYIASAILFAVGLILCIRAIIETQKDAPRPAVSSSFDKATSLLTVKATAEGLANDGHLAVRVEGIVQSGVNRRGNTLSPTFPPIYVAESGPGSDGKAAHTVLVYVPARYSLVGVKAWTTDSVPECPVARPQEAV